MTRRRLMMLKKKEDNRVYLYNYGDECVDITGGWRSGGYTRGSNYKFEKRADHLYLYSGATANTTLSCATQLPIELSEYKTVHFLVDSVVNTQNRNNRVQVSRYFTNTNNTSNAFTYFYGQELKTLGNINKTEIVLNMEDIINANVLYQGKGYPSMVCDTWNSSNIKDGYIKLYQCWLEK